MKNGCFRVARMSDLDLSEQLPHLQRLLRRRRLAGMLVMRLAARDWFSGEH
jgi:hypothetical protein